MILRTLLFLLFIASLAESLVPRPCATKKMALAARGQQCRFCHRTKVIVMHSLIESQVIHEYAGCADEEWKNEDMPPGMMCTSHMGTNSTGKGSDFLLYFTAREGRELIAKRCCENFDGRCNKPFAVRYPQKFMMRQIKREPPKLMGIFICCVLFIAYFVFRIHSTKVNRMSYDVTKKEQLRMYGYRDDPLEPMIIENRSKVEEPEHAVARAFALPSFNIVLNAIFDIQYYLNSKKYDAIWTQALPKMKKDAKMRGLKPPSSESPARFFDIPEMVGMDLVEQRKHSNFKTIFCDIVKHQTMSSKIMRKQTRPVPSGFNELLLKLIEHGPYDYPFKAAELFNIFEKAKDAFAQDTTVLQLLKNQIVIGDIRGRYQDMFRFFNTFGWPPHRSYLFLGGIIENEEDQSIECMALLAALKCALPKHVFLLRGAGETVPYVPGRRFPGRNGEVVANALARLCNALSLAAVINGKILCTHSGVTTHFKGKSRLNNIIRPFTIEDMSEAGRRIIFAVPETNCRMFRMRPHEKNGEVFGSKAVQKTLECMKLELLIRSRSLIADGYCLHWDSTVLSIWSSLGVGVTKAAAVEIDAGCRLTLHLLDTRATITKDLTKRVSTNVMKLKERGGGERKADDDEEEEEDMFAEEEKHCSEKSKNKTLPTPAGPPHPTPTNNRRGGSEEKDMQSARTKEETDENVDGPLPEISVKQSMASAEQIRGGRGKESAETMLRMSREESHLSRERTQDMTLMMDESALNKTQDASSKKQRTPKLDDEQKTQSERVGESPMKSATPLKTGQSHKKSGGKKKEDDKMVEKTPDMSDKKDKTPVVSTKDGVPSKSKTTRRKAVEEEAEQSSRYESALSHVLTPHRKTPIKMAQKVKSAKAIEKEAVTSVRKNMSEKRKGMERTPPDSLKESRRPIQKTKYGSREGIPGEMVKEPEEVAASSKPRSLTKKEEKKKEEKRGGEKKK